MSTLGKERFLHPTFFLMINPGHENNKIEANSQCLKLTNCLKHNSDTQRYILHST